MTIKRMARVFPRKTNMTPDDDLVFFDLPPMDLPEIDEVHVSCTWTYDRNRAEELAYQWEAVGVPVKIGGPAYDDPGGEFTPGMYIKHGGTITSRGCNNRCWFCMAQKREGKLRELEIKPGYNIMDNNLLQCSPEHIRAVCDMLKTQTERAVFTGGLEAKELKDWHCDLLREVKPKTMYFAYDTPDDYDPLVEAGKKLRRAGFNPSGHSMKCYNLVGYKGDTFEKAEKRLMDTCRAGFVPFAMLYRDEQGQVDDSWKRFQREWANAFIAGKHFDELWKTEGMHD